MRKRVKVITEEIHEHGVIAFEIPLYERLLDVTQLDNFRDEHIDMIFEKSIKISEEEDGDVLTTQHFPAIVAGTPAESEK